MTAGENKTQATTEASQPPEVARRQCVGISPIAVCLVVFCVSLLSFLQAAHHRGILWAPPENGGDEDSYERIGYNLAAGLGFGNCPCDDPIVAGLEEPQPTERCAPNCSPDDFETTAYRPPGFPFLIAAVNLIDPLNFAMIRIINCIFCAAGVAIVALFLVQS